MTSIIFLFFLVPVLALVLIGLNLLLAPHKPYKEKDSSFECGFHSFLGQNRSEFSISFFLFGLLFLVFDLEIVLIYPYAVSAYINGSYGLIIVFAFLIILTAGFVFEIGKKALSINSKQTNNLTGIQESAHHFNYDSITPDYNKNTFKKTTLNPLLSTASGLLFFTLLLALSWVYSNTGDIVNYLSFLQEGFSSLTYSFFLGWNKKGSFSKRNHLFKWFSENYLKFSNINCKILLKKAKSLLISYLKKRFKNYLIKQGILSILPIIEPYFPVGIFCYLWLSCYSIFSKIYSFFRLRNPLLIQFVSNVISLNLFQDRTTIKQSKELGQLKSDINFMVEDLDKKRLKSSLKMNIPNLHETEEIFNRLENPPIHFKTGPGSLVDRLFRIRHDIVKAHILMNKRIESIEKYLDDKQASLDHFDKTKLKELIIDIQKEKMVMIEKFKWIYKKANENHEIIELNKRASPSFPPFAMNSLIEHENSVRLLEGKIDSLNQPQITSVTDQLKSMKISSFLNPEDQESRGDKRARIKKSPILYELYKQNILPCNIIEGSEETSGPHSPEIYPDGTRKGKTKAD